MPVEFTAQLKALKVTEGDSATFSCELSKPANSVVWMKDGRKIENDENYELSQDGTLYSLCLPNTSKADAGKYTMSIGDKETSAKLVVNGQRNVFISKSTSSFPWLYNLVVIL